MPPAVIAGGIAAAGTIGGAIIGSKSQKAAASQANDAQQAAVQAQLQLGQQSLALNRDIYNSNYGILSPFVSRGNVAGDAINALLGLPAAPRMSSPLAGTASPMPTNPSAPATPSAPAAPLAAVSGMAPAAAPTTRPYILGTDGLPLGAARGTVPGDVPQNSDMVGNGYRAGGTLAAQNFFARQGGVASPTPTVPASGGSPAAPSTPTAPATPTTTPQTAQSALNNFANSAGMKFQLEQGANALNNLYAGRGQLQSGAAMKGISDYAQNTALNNYFMPYMGLLSGQQSVGAGAASSVAGVGQNFGNTAAAINGQMGSSIQSGADSAANAALLRGQANANMWTGIGGALGGLASSFFPAKGY